MPREIQVESLFDEPEDPTKLSDQTDIWFNLYKKHGLDLDKPPPRDFTAINRAEAEAWVLENAAIRNLTVKEMLRNVVETRARIGLVHKK